MSISYGKKFDIEFSALPREGVELGTSIFHHGSTKPSFILFLLYRGVRGDTVKLISNYIHPTLENPSSMYSPRNTKTITKKRNSSDVMGISTSAEVDWGVAPCPHKLPQKV
jgi:hypothetical protein